MVDYSCLLDFFKEVAPPFLSYDWDNSGSQVTFDKERIDKLLLGLDPAEDLIDYALQKNADLVVTHHPLLFNPLKEIDIRSPLGSKIYKLLKNEVGLYSIHTNFDRSERGLSEALASYLDLKSREPIDPVPEANFYKVVVFLPPESEAEMKQALFDIGAGDADLYSEVSFVSRGVESFKPLEGADPYIGKIGKRCEKEELRLEIQVQKDKLKAVEDIIESRHPYEEPAYDILRTEKINKKVGLGRIGKWEKPKKLEETVYFIREELKLADSGLEVFGDPEATISKVAVSPGSGGGVLDKVLSSPIDLFVTGELDYHERQALLERGAALVELGHRNSEKIFSPWLRDLISESFSKEELEILLFEEDTVARGN